jgi:glycosyltransferase involved in cell wall biosynthesis
MTSTIRERKLVSIVIPVFRNEGSLLALHIKLVEAVAMVCHELDYEIIFVDDGSDDNSLNELLSIAGTDPRVVVIKLSRNFGQFAANNAGFQFAKGDVVINMSADLQDPPELIVPMIEKILDGSDIVLAVRTKTAESFFKSLTSKIHYKLVRISVPNFPKGGFDFWAVNKRAFTAFMSFTDVIRRNQIDLLSIGYKVSTVEYEKQPRIHGSSQYTFFKRLNISITQILTTAFWPLRMASALGVFFTLAGLIYTTYLFFSYFVRQTPFEGWTPIMMLILIIGGIIMTMLGIIGEYLWRIYFEAKKRPLYFIDEVHGPIDKKTEREQ